MLFNIDCIKLCSSLISICYILNLVNKEIVTRQCIKLVFSFSYLVHVLLSTILVKGQGHKIRVYLFRLNILSTELTLFKGIFWFIFCTDHTFDNLENYLILSYFSSYT